MLKAHLLWNVSVKSILVTNIDWGKPIAHATCSIIDSSEQASLFLNSFDKSNNTKARKSTPSFFFETLMAKAGGGFVVVDSLFIVASVFAGVLCLVLVLYTY